MKIYRFLLLLCCFCVFVSKAKAQNISNEGTDFWAVFPTHVPSNNQLANMNIFVTGKNDSEVTVSCGTYSETKTVPANMVVVFNVPRAVSYIDNADANTVLSNKGIRIKVSEGRPAVAVYAHVYAGARSAASLILPYDALGQKYYSMNYTQTPTSGRNFLVLVAVEPNTVLRLTERNGTVRTITLPNIGDVYEYLAPASTDITGIQVEVDGATSQCKRFAAFSGSTNIYIGGCPSNNSSDPLFQQLYATNSWGKIYAVAPFIDRRYIVRVLAQEDNTRININGTIITRNRGQFYETSQLTTGAMITADKLISVAQYSLTQPCSSTSGGSIMGDPDMVLINPVEFSIKHITLFSSDNQAIVDKYINVVIKTDSRSTFRVNGALPPANATWTTFPTAPEYSYIQIKVTQQSITLSADEGFNAIAYGYGNVESYAYSAGTSLSANRYLTVINGATNMESADACIGEKSDFALTAPYLFNKLVWKFNDGTPDYEYDDPVPIVKEVNGEILYEYRAPVEKVYTTLGQKVVVATGYFSTDVNSCFGSHADFEFTFNVDPLPTAAFTSVAETCPKVEVAFTDNSITNVNGKSIARWQWDFGDGSPISTERNPRHIYTSAGRYTIKLMAIGENGCASDIIEKEIEVLTEIQPDFAVSDITCIAVPITFTDQSTVEGDQTIVKWLWDMGDGTPVIEKTDNSPFSHQYENIGTYRVKLILVSNKGCYSSEFYKEITIHPNPVVDFEMPNYCVADGEAIFINKSIGLETGQFTYLWDFGDPNANAQRPNTSTQPNGAHAYTQSGWYEVTLTVTSANGCVAFLKKQFRVNGTPQAAFDVLNQNNLCSNTEVTFTDRATVDFGEITKIEWYFDYANKTTPDIVDENPNTRADEAKIYTYKYPTFSNVANKSYAVVMKAYSGSTCVSMETKNIIIYPEAAVDFAIQDNCLPNGVATFNNLSVYPDPSVSLSYLWDFGDSQASGSSNTSTEKEPLYSYSSAGTYQVSLTVTTSYGCSKTITKEIVVEGAVPVADFTIRNSTALCSQDPVVFEENTTLAFGEITKIEWYYDFENNPTQVEVDMVPGTRQNPKIYEHLYPVFNYPFTKNYVVKMMAYAGDVCVGSIQKTITLKAVPDIEFEKVDVCLQTSSINLLAREKNNMPGIGAFSGNGVNASGVFIPANAGVGTHHITYTYSVSDGCTVDKIQTVTVYETPIVDAGEDKIILEGGQTTLSAIALGPNLTYKWSPSTGLNRDDVLNPIARPTQDITYTLLVTSDKGCYAMDEVRVKITSIELTNTITPNGDYINDTWNIKYIDSYPNAKIEIYDRAGRRVFESVGYKKAFDGTYHNNPLPVGIYYYIISLDSSRKPLTGTITIIR